MALYKLYNGAAGHRGVQTGNGLVMLGSQETLNGVELTDDEVALAKNIAGFEVSDADDVSATIPGATENLPAEGFIDPNHPDAPAPPKPDGSEKAPASKGKSAKASNEKQSGSEPPPLNGMNKATLLETAKAEGVTVEEDATNAEITKAIEDARASK